MEKLFTFILCSLLAVSFFAIAKDASKSREGIKKHLLGK